MTNVFDEFLTFLEGLFVSHAKDVVTAANSPTGQAIAQAAATAAVDTAVQDPKVQAGIAVYQAVKNYNAVVNSPSPTPVHNPPAPTTEPTPGIAPVTPPAA